MGVRDNEGAVRYLDHGNIPFTKEIVEFHRQKISEREKAQGKKIDYKTVIDDIYAISRGPLVTRY
jgi:methylaspartate mutase epsilon subunit